MQTTHEDEHYLRGFDDGCDFIVREIKLYAEQHRVYLGDLIHHLEVGDDVDKD